MRRGLGTVQGVSVLVGGVGELFQGDLDLGRMAAARLKAERLGDEVFVEELHYGAVAVTQRLDELRPDFLILVGAVARGRPPGVVARRHVIPPQLTPAEFQAAVGDAVVGYVAIDLIVEVATGLSSLPARTIAIEVEPENVGYGEGLTASAASGLEIALDIVRKEVGRAPLMDMADTLRPLVVDSRLAATPLLAAMRELLADLQSLVTDGDWGSSQVSRNRVAETIRQGSADTSCDWYDWQAWLALIDEFDRVQQVEASRAVV